VLCTRAISSTDWVSELEKPWKELLAASPSATPFQTWEWQSIWWKYYAKARKPVILGVYEGNDLVGLMPLMISRAPWRTLRAMSSGAADYLHPLARSGYEGLVAEQLVGYMQEAEGFDLIDLHQLRETLPLAQLAPQGKVLYQATCLVLDLPTSFDEYLSSIGKSLRFDVRKLDKELFTSGRATIEDVDEEGLTRGLDCFFQTHRERWRKRGLPGAFIGTKSERFHGEWARAAQRNGWLWLSVLHLDEQPIGTIYAMRLAKACYYYQAGFSPNASAVSPGSLLVGHTIRRAINEGLNTFDFLRGDEPYKRRWKPQHEYRNLRVLAPGKNVRGKIGQAWNDAGNRVESKVRARLEGRGLFK
jgi:CelD/BcsL family acetyltransferase involved in cellulose biosynthesis